MTHHIEHIVARQYGGRNDVDNLALACHRRNFHKGVSGELVPLFHPRHDHWAEHFLLWGVRIEGITPVGRATAHVLAMNDARRTELRSELLAQGKL